MDIPHERPMAECDLIMKGGITSGIVYPKAILTLAETYRFRSIGGASAGAIGAAMTAAAEYGRANGGFKIVAEIPGAIGGDLLSLFQSSRETKPLFTVFILAIVRKRKLAAVIQALLAMWPATLAGALIGVVFAVLAGQAKDGWGFVAGVCVALFLAAALGLNEFVQSSLKALARFDYGLCPGPTQPGNTRPGFSDWIAETIEKAAGRMANGVKPSTPLTFGDLWEASFDGKPGTTKEPSIDLRMMTTNLSMRRPSVLPQIGDRNYYFKPDELKRVLPDWIVDFMVARSEAFGTDGHYQFPKARDLPVAVAVRMSLSFPILISAVPLYRRNFGGTTDGAMTRVLFSDGGVSSNFPIHFFDAFLPRRPTFAISLDDKADLRGAGTDALVDAEPGAEDASPAKNDGRVRLPMRAGSGLTIPIKEIGSLPAFAMAIINAAKDWQDQLQSNLSGYRERIAHVHLDDTEGGMNLTMEKEVIGRLVTYGERAGELLAGQQTSQGDRSPFDFEDHRWRRFLVAFAALEDALGRTSDVWRNHGFRDFIGEYRSNPASYRPKDQEWMARVVNRFDGLMEAAKDWKGNPLARRKGIPQPRTDLRITARPYDEGDND